MLSTFSEKQKKIILSLFAIVFIISVAIYGDDVLNAKDGTPVFLSIVAGYWFIILLLNWIRKSN